MGSMVSGGLQVLEDRMYGYHEGYLVTPISTGTLVAGNILAGAVVASVAGGLVLAAVVFVTPLPLASAREPRRGLRHGVSDVALDRGALVPALRAGPEHEPPPRHVRDHQRASSSFPRARSTRSSRTRPGSRSVAAIDPLTYGVRALRNLLLRGAAPSSAYADWVFLATFTVVCGVLTKVLFKREV